MSAEERSFTQKDYNILVDNLDRAVAVFLDLGKSELDAREALANFVAGHYSKFWRAMMTE